MIIGDSGVGKTSIFNRFFTDKFKEDQQASLGANFKTTYVSIPQSEWIEEDNYRYTKIGE